MCSPLAPRVQSDHPPRRPPASGAATATPGAAAVGKQRVAQLADVRRKCAAEVKRVNRAYTDLQATWGHDQVRRDAVEHDLEREIKGQVRAPPKP